MIIATEHWKLDIIAIYAAATRRTTKLPLLLSVQLTVRQLRQELVSCPYAESHVKSLREQISRPVLVSVVG